MDQADSQASLRLRAAVFFAAGLFVIVLLLEGLRRYSEMTGG